MTGRAFPNALTPLSESLYGERIVAPGESLESVARTMTGIVLEPRADRRRWMIAAGACAALALLTGLVIHGAGHDGPLSAPLAMASFEGWIGISEGSLLVSAVLLLAGVEWRCAVSRIAETVALLAAIAAGFCALIPVEPWRAGAGLHPPFGAPVLWQAAGIGCLIVVCASHWFIGLLPDLAALRERGGPAVYGRLAAGWRGSALQWRRWDEAYRATALLGALLAITLQVAASVALSTSAAPGRQDTLLPVTYLVDAVLSGIGATAAVVVVIRAMHRLGTLITRRHLDILARLILVFGLASLYCHATTILAVLLHGEAGARASVARGFHGDLAWAFWTVVLCGLLPAQIFWLPRARRSGLAIALVGTLVAVAAHADHAMGLAVTLPDGAAIADRSGDMVGLLALAGSIGLFCAGLILALHALPIVSIAQMRQLVLAHNPAPAPVPTGTGIDARGGPAASLRWIAAEFATIKTLAAATGTLLGRDRRLRLDAFSPVPMPEVVEILRPTLFPVRITALIGAMIGGFNTLLLCLAAAQPITYGQVEAWPGPAWPSYLLPSVAAALTAGTLTALLALVLRGRPASGEIGFPRACRGRFVLTARVEDRPGEAERIEQRLIALPAADGRPLAIHRIAE